MMMEAESEQKPPRWTDAEGRTYYRASSLGMCDKMFVALANYYEPRAKPDWFQEVLDEGTRNEPVIIQQAQEKYDDLVVESQGTILLEVLSDVFITGYIDGEWSRDIGKVRRGVEIKKIRESVWSKFMQQGVEYLPFYPWQVSAYWYGREWEQCDVIGGRLNEAGEIDLIERHILTAPPIPLKALRLRIMKLEGMIADGNQPVDVKCNVRQFPCPVFYLHDDSDDIEPPTRPTDDVVEPLLNEIALLEPDMKKLKAAEERVKALKRGVHAWLLAGGVEPGEASRVTLTDGTTREIKYKSIHRDGYEVKATDYVQVDVAMVGEDGKKVSTRGKKGTK